MLPRRRPRGPRSKPGTVRVTARSAAQGTPARAATARRRRGLHVRHARAGERSREPEPAPGGQHRPVGGQEPARARPGNRPRATGPRAAPASASTCSPVLANREVRLDRDGCSAPASPVESELAPQPAHRSRPRGAPAPPPPRGAPPPHAPPAPFPLPPRPPGPHTRRRPRAPTPRPPTTLSTPSTPDPRAPPTPPATPPGPRPPPNDPPPVPAVTRARARSACPSPSPSPAPDPTPPPAPRGADSCPASIPLILPPRCAGATSSSSSPASAALVYEVVWSRLLARLLGSDAIGDRPGRSPCSSAGMGLGAFLLAGRRAPGARASRGDSSSAYALGARRCGRRRRRSLLEAVLSPGGRRPSARGRLRLSVALPGGPHPGDGRRPFPVMGAALRSARATRTPARPPRASTGRTPSARPPARCFAPFVLLPLLGPERARGGRGGGHARTCSPGSWRTGAGPRLRRRPRARARDRRAVPGSPRPGLHPLDLSPLLLTGFASLAFEVGMVRVLVSLMGASVYAFAIVLAVFLLGIGAGAAGWRSRLAVTPRHGAAGRARPLTPPLAAPLLAGAGLLAPAPVKAGQDAFDARLANLVRSRGRAPREALDRRTRSSRRSASSCCRRLAFGAALPACRRGAASSAAPGSRAGGGARPGSTR